MSCLESDGPSRSSMPAGPISEFCRRGLGIVLVAFALNLLWEVLQMPYYSGPSLGVAPSVRSHLGSALVDAFVILVIYWLGARLLQDPRWRLGLDPWRWGFLLAAGAVAALGIEWRALYVAGTWTYAAGMPRIPGLGVGLLPVLQMLLLPAATLVIVEAALERWDARPSRSRRPPSEPTSGRTGQRATSSSAVLALSLSFLAMGAPASAEVADQAMPSSLSELRLAQLLLGEEARNEMDRLHGKSIPLQEAFVAHYQGAGRTIVLYVAVASDEATAQDQVEQMTARMRGANGPFAHLGERVMGGALVHSLFGQRQVHLHFRRGSRVVWVGADSGLARRALAEVMDYYP